MTCLGGILRFASLYTMETCADVFALLTYPRQESCARVRRKIDALIESFICICFYATCSVVRDTYSIAEA